MDGEYTILVSDSGQNNSGNYTLDLQRVPPLVPERYLSYNTPSSVSLGHRGDHDFLTFEGTAGDMIRISVSGLSNNLDGAFALYGPDGLGVEGGSGSCSASTYATCSVASANLIVPADGTYSLMLYDAGNNDTGSLSVTVTCLLGTCPPNWVQVGTSYCETNANSTGNPAVIKVWGSDIASDQSLELYCSDVPANQPGIFFMGPNQVSVPFGDGNRCVGGQLQRFGVTNSYNRAQFRYSLDFANMPNNVVPLPTETWNFQCWFRDPAAGGAAFNLSDGLAITFQ